MEPKEMLETQDRNGMNDGLILSIVDIERSYIVRYDSYIVRLSTRYLGLYTPA